MLNDAVCDACGNMYVGLDHNGQGQQWHTCVPPSPLFLLMPRTAQYPLRHWPCERCVLEPPSHVDVGVDIDSTPRQRLILAETYAQRITVFDVDLDDNNMATGRYTIAGWAELPGIFPTACAWMLKDTSGRVAARWRCYRALGLGSGVMEPGLDRRCALAKSSCAEKEVVSWRPCSSTPKEWRSRVCWVVTTVVHYSCSRRSH